MEGIEIALISFGFVFILAMVYEFIGLLELRQEEKATKEYLVALKAKREKELEAHRAKYR